MEAGTSRGRREATVNSGPGANLRSVGVHFSLRSVSAASAKIIKEFVKRMGSGTA